MNLREKNITKTLRYFSHFSYAPTLIDLHTFLEIPQSLEDLKKSLRTLQKDEKVVEKGGKYTLGEYSQHLVKTAQSFRLSTPKKVIGMRYVKLIMHIPFIQFIALTGSLSMNNAAKYDDIDLFIVARENRMWITRALSLLAAELLGVRRKRLAGSAPDKVCLNMFFDEADMLIPKDKKTLYIAHELLQMKPLFNRNKTYEKLLQLNSWVFELFPNASKYYIKDNLKISKSIKRYKAKKTFLGNICEQLLGQFQLYFIKKHRTKERITKTQLWFFPNDYEKML